MSLPEISRRCLSCGAAVRAGARFCQQCGKAVGDENSSAVAQAAEGVGQSSNGDDISNANEASAPTTRDAEAPREWVAPTREFSAFVEKLEFDNPRGETASSAASDEASASAPVMDARDDVAKTTPITRPAETVAVDNAAVAANDASVAAEDGRSRVAQVREGTRVRAERIRNDARVALAVTADDAGLRFVVVAVAVFVLFLFFLFLSTTVLR
jgi:hypothetical protein